MGQAVAQLEEDLVVFLPLGFHANFQYGGLGLRYFLRGFFLAGGNAKNGGGRSGGNIFALFLG